MVRVFGPVFGIMPSTGQRSDSPIFDIMPSIELRNDGPILSTMPSTGWRNFWYVPRIILN